MTKGEIRTSDWYAEKKKAEALDRKATIWLSVIVVALLGLDYWTYPSDCMSSYRDWAACLIDSGWLFLPMLTVLAVVGLVAMLIPGRKQTINEMFSDELPKGEKP